MFAGECLLVKRAKSNEWSRAREHRKFSPCQSGERTDERARARARIARPDCKFIAGNCFAARPPIVYGHGERVPIHSARARLVLKGPGQSAPIPATASSSASSAAEVVRRKQVSNWGLFRARRQPQRELLEKTLRRGAREFQLDLRERVCERGLSLAPVADDDEDAADLSQSPLK